MAAESDGSGEDERDISVLRGVRRVVTEELLLLTESLTRSTALQTLD
jgi:hypothetical protein